MWSISFVARVSDTTNWFSKTPSLVRAQLSADKALQCMQLPRVLLAPAPFRPRRMVKTAVVYTVDGTCTCRLLFSVSEFHKAYAFSISLAKVLTQHKTNITAVELCQRLEMSASTKSYIETQNLTENVVTLFSYIFDQWGRKIDSAADALCALGKAFSDQQQPILSEISKLV